MIRLDDETVTRMIQTIDSFDEKLSRRDMSYEDKQDLLSENRSLKDKVQELETRLTLPEFRSKLERATELDTQEQHIKDIKKLEYERGYAAAYVEVTNKMKGQ